MTAQRLEDTNELPVIARHGDYLVDTTTGVILGLAKVDDRWHPTSEDDIEFVLSLILDARAEIAKVERKRRFVNQNLDMLARDQERRIAWLDFRFGGTLEQLARERLAGAKKRSWRLMNGVLRFRKKQARRIVVDGELALAWAAEHAPDAVAVKRTLLVSMLPDGEVPGIAVEPEVDTFAIDVSVGD